MEWLGELCVQTESDMVCRHTERCAQLGHFVGGRGKRHRPDAWLAGPISVRFRLARIRLGVFALHIAELKQTTLLYIKYIVYGGHEAALAPIARRLC